MRSSVTISCVSQASLGPFVFHGDLRQGVESAARLGFDAVEIFPPSPESIPRSDLRAMVADHAMGVAALGTGAGWLIEKWTLADPDPAVRTQAIAFVRRMIEVGCELDAPAIIGSMQGRSSPGTSLHVSRGWLRESLETLDQFATACRGRLLYEPLNRYETDQCNTIAQGLEMIRGLKSTKLLADWFHMNIEEANMEETLEHAGSAIGHVHFADTNRHAIGFGHLDAEPLVRALHRMGYAGYLSAEVFPRPDGETAARRTIEAFREFTQGL
jgi:sugar phosphate isomerase/epimerase